MNVKAKVFALVVVGQVLVATTASAASNSNISQLQRRADKEGTVTWYVAMNPKEAHSMAEEFMKEYPRIQVNYLTMRANKIPLRITTEQRAGKYTADVVSASAWNISSLQYAHALQKYVPQQAKNLVPQARDKQHYWVGEYILTMPIAYNAKTLASDGLPPPKSYKDLTKPQYKGKFSIEVTDYEWFHTMSTAAYSHHLMDELAKNDPQFRNGHTTNMNGLISGEFPISIGIYGYKAYEAQKKGYPIKIVHADPTVAEWQLAGIVKHAPHPAAAKFFENWLISKSGQAFAKKIADRTPTRNDVPANDVIYDPKEDHMAFSNPYASNRYSEVEKDFNQTFHINGR